jgi:hypothetical protein
MIIAGNGIYETCRDCGKLVRLNKPVFGALHFCLSPEERCRKQWAEQMYRQQQKFVSPYQSYFPKVDK